METTNPTHFQLYIQITHYADISRYCTGSHMSRSVIMLLYWKSPDQTFYCATSLLVTCYHITTAGKRFSLALITVKIVQINCIKS